MGDYNTSKVDFWLTEDGLTLVKAWTRDGITIEEICKKIGIQRNTYYRWVEQYKVFRDAVNTSRELIDYKVENALLKAALGYKTKEIKVTIGKKIFNGETVEMLKETTTKEVAPNVTACMAWLNNRKHDQWKRNRDKVMELDEEDNNISITIVRGPKSDGNGDNLNQEINVHPKTDEERKAEKEAKRKAREQEEYDDSFADAIDLEEDTDVEEDLSCWDDWDEDDE